MVTVMEILTSNIGRAVRAHKKSKDNTLPKSQKDFHAGRREAYLQIIAQINGCEVKEIRKTVLGSEA